LNKKKRVAKPIMPKLSHHYDILIAGAGFAGAITALALQKKGLKVGLLEKGKHPRFAIGESSTPVADMILRKLSEQYDLPWLYDFSRYGSWQKTHPEIICGLKRGFSFFKHQPGKEFFTDDDHSNEFLVAASASDELSDTNWLRSDVDNFLVTKVKESGIDYFELTEIIEAKRNEEWEFEILRSNEPNKIYCSFFIDATGSSDLSKKLVANDSSNDAFLTHSFALFSHFTNVPRWTKILEERKIPVAGFPFDPDWSALHHVLDEGWMWMLRFKDERTSIGFVLDDKEAYKNLSTEHIWNNLLEKYPSVKFIIENAKLHSQPGGIIKTGRLQRKMKKGFGEGWVALPHSVGFVDPLFSPGIAHSLSGVEMLLGIIDRCWNDPKVFYENLERYEKKVFEELKLIDCLIAGCYQAMPYFQLFNAWSMLYFTCTIAHEQRRIKNEPAGSFLNADDPVIAKIVAQSYDDLVKIISSGAPKNEDIKNFTEKVKKQIQPFNTAGLLDPSAKNMYHHTVAVF
jgi:FADH2 O2-dependent halogenase